MSAARLENQKRATDLFIDARRRLSVDDMVKLRTPDCIQETAPSTLLGTPNRTNEEWLTDLRPTFGYLDNFKADVHSVTHDPEAGRTVLYADTSADAVWGDYKDTHIMILTWNEAGDCMAHTLDMMDSAGLLKRMGMIQAWQEKQEKA